MNDFVHLHVHSEYSLLDGACRIKELVSRAKEMGQNAVAITDHGVMYGVVDFYNECISQGVKPILGCEVYVAPRTRFDKEHVFDSDYYHLVLLCETTEGYHNLMKLVSLGFTDGFYIKPRVDEEVLRLYSKGLICLSACIAGEVPRYLLQGDYEKAKQTVFKYQEIFGKENYFIEIQDHDIEEQRRVLPMLVKLSKETGAGLVATNDAHYIRKEDALLQRVLLCIQMNKTLDNPDRYGFPTEEFYLKSASEMAERFSAFEGAMENTVRIADRCNVSIEFGNTILPYFVPENNEDPFDCLQRMSFEGAYKKYGNELSQEIINRLNYELTTIKNMGYVEYYLIVHDFINYAKTHDIPVGPGRGSGAGSLVAYCIGITGIDPLKFNLIFERFLNPERVSMPDFDVDFCVEKRGQVIDYITRKYGSDHVAQIITFGTLAARAAVRDVGRVMGVSYSETDYISKLIPFNAKLSEAVNSIPELKKKYDEGGTVKQLIDIAMRAEGMPRHASTHAAGVVITRDKVSDYVPLMVNADSVVTQYPKDTLERLGLLKVDCLGLRNLTVIDNAAKLIKNRNPNFDIDSISFDDERVYDMLSKGTTEGVFQLESSGMRSLLTSLKPDNIEDIIAAISLYRPGPMDSIPSYIKNRANKNNIKYDHPLLSNILDVTYGCVIYQEQVMQIVRELAGYSLGRADLVRRAMAKKKADVMRKERHNFVFGKSEDADGPAIDGCIKRGVDEATGNRIFDNMMSFASYAFNKSHAAAYAIVAYQTAYLKAIYPKEYMAALLSSVMNSTDKISEYTNECRRINIKILKPSINKSMEFFTSEDSGIRVGLLAIKGVGYKFATECIKERSLNGNYKNIFDFIKRNAKNNDVNKQTIGAMIRCGVFDDMGATRKQMLTTYEKFITQVNASFTRDVVGQISLFSNDSDSQYDEPVFDNDSDEYSFNDILRMEKEYMGLYISGHPMTEYLSSAMSRGAKEISEIVSDNGQEISDLRNSSKVIIAGIVVDMKKKTTKNGQIMAFATVEDMSGQIECLLFPAVFESILNLLNEDTPILVTGRVDFREEEAPKIVADKAEILSKTPLANSAINKINEVKPQVRKGLYLKVPSVQSKEFDISKKIISVFDGLTPVYYYFLDEKALKCAPRNMWVSINNVMLNELQKQIGDGNVKVVE